MSAASVEVTTTPNLAGISDDLRAIPRWLHWRPEPKANGKTDKIPTDPATGENIDHTASQNWRTFDDAVAALRPGLGLGIYLNGDGIIGVDRDRCVDEHGTLSDEALADVAAFGSHAEISPSGRGIRIITRGVLPPKDRKNGPCEIYDSGRFLTITGNRVPGAPATIAEAQNAIDTFHATYIARPETTAPSSPLPIAPLTVDDQEVLRLLRSFRNADDFERSWNGDASKFGGDQSRNDQALASYVAFVTQDREQILRIISQSPVWDTKWERPDYQKRTLDRALNRPEFYTPPAVIVLGEHRRENGAVVGNPQDAGTDGDPCESVRDELARLRAENATLRRHLARRDEQLATTEAERDQLRRLQSATMDMLRSRTMRPGEKVLGLVSLFEVEAAQCRGAIDAAGWLTVPMGRLADAGGCSTDTAGRHLTTIASTGVIETRTITERDPDSGEVRKRRQIRLPAPSDAAPAQDLVGRITVLSTATPERDATDRGWGGRRICPDCGDVGTVTLTTVACAGCGAILSTSRTAQPPADDAPPPKPHLAGTKNGQPQRGCSSPKPQLAGTGTGRVLIAPGAPAGTGSRRATQPSPGIDDYAPEAQHRRGFCSRCWSALDVCLCGPWQIVPPEPPPPEVMDAPLQAVPLFAEAADDAGAERWRR